MSETDPNTAPPPADPHMDFFVGWRGPVGAQRRFLSIVAAAFIGVTALAGLSLGAGIDPVSAGPFRLGDAPTAEDTPGPGDWEWGATLRGTVTNRPYQMLHVTPEPGQPQGRTVLLTGAGKSAVDGLVDGQSVALSGGLLRRGSIEVLAVLAEPVPMTDAIAPPPAAQALGRWRVTGEICDGKCAVGAMRPGTGLSHRACANLCISGDVPIVFVTAAPVAGARFLLLADADGRALSESVYPLVARPVSLEGELERRGNLIVFKVDLQKARRL